MKTLTKLKDQMSQLMSMVVDIKRKIGIEIPSNTENNLWKEEKEHVKVKKVNLKSGASARR
ncbi:hypothetical protein J1N35_014919 [Gossypium stocksii]|uniref:Uncharacterized protein n=1 Tax=Gossypium stocksii TaxID=47602 RepID=A0A9D4A846_9ROSI|nr:hypothetical protein J1N35_014919 [Gossypium stocksii]